jgi:hypothetical protein
VTTGTIHVKHEIRQGAIYVTGYLFISREKIILVNALINNILIGITSRSRGWENSFKRYFHNHRILETEKILLIKID